MRQKKVKNYYKNFSLHFLINLFLYFFIIENEGKYNLLNSEALNTSPNLDEYFNNNDNNNNELRKYQKNFHFLKYFSINPYLAKNYFFYQMIKLIKSLDHIDCDYNCIFHNNKEKELENSLMESPLYQYQDISPINNNNNYKIENEIVEFKEDPITKTIIINGYYIHLTEVISHGDNSVIYKAIRENSEEIFVKKRKKKENK